MRGVDVGFHVFTSYVSLGRNVLCRRYTKNLIELARFGYVHNRIHIPSMRSFAIFGFLPLQLCREMPHPIKHHSLQ
jgi:hypothetical protein